MENMTTFNEPRCTCGHLWSDHANWLEVILFLAEHGDNLNLDYSCDNCQCGDFEEDFTQPLFDVGANQ